MGMYTELEYTVKLDEKNMEDVVTMLSSSMRSNYKPIWNHPLSTDDRWFMLGKSFVVDGDYLIGVAEIKNYTNTYYKFFDLLRTIGHVVMFRELYEENYNRDYVDGDWEDFLNMSKNMQDYYNEEMSNTTTLI